MNEKYEKRRQEAKVAIQQLAKELIEKGVLSADLDYQSDEAIQLAIKYENDKMKKKWEATKEERRIREEKRKALPPLETWLDSDKTAKELYEMGYSYLEMMELGSRLW